MPKMIDLTSTLSFTDEEIEKIETQFFGVGGSFNSEQKRVINCFSKENIQACPGSGKTTTLAAKLLLLKTKLHRGINGGVCILTHTNVAVDMIKERLGTEGAAFYNNYPNYLGTIQSFVNKYLAIPAYKQIYKSSIEAIDDDVFYAVIGRRTRSASNAASYLSRSKQIDHLGVLSFNRYNFDISENINTTDPIVGKHTTSYGELERLKNSLLSEGFLKYDEAYSLAFRYLRDHPNLIPLFSKRFPLVFLDEMQDTEEFQFDLLNQLFGQDSIFQTIGDGNQDIFGHYEAVSLQWPKSASYSIATSSRFPQHIADTITKMGVEQQVLIGNTSTSPILPYIIVYNDSTINLVKNKFGELIISNGLHRKANCVFKAVGGRKDAGQINITSYFPEFTKNANKVREYYTTMDDYLNALTVLKLTTTNTKKYKDLIFSLFLQILKLAGIRDTVRDRLFTSSSFERYLKLIDPVLYQKFRVQIGKSIKDFLNGVDIKAELLALVQNELLPHFQVVTTTQLSDFISSPATTQIAVNPQTKQNVFGASYSGEQVDILFDTIHAVKGETHTGTLYLETYTRTFDIQKLLPLICGTQNRTVSFIGSNRTRMKQAYVAMSRPTELLCLAVHEDRINLAIDWLSHGITIVHC